MKQQSWRSI